MLDVSLDGSNKQIDIRHPPSTIHVDTANPGTPALCFANSIETIHLKEKVSIPLSTSRAFFFQQLLGLVHLTGQVRAAPSIRMIRQHQCAMIAAYFVFCQRSLAEFEDQRCFSFGHLRFEAAFVEGSAEGVEAVGVPVAAEGHEAGATLQSQC